MSLWCWLSCSRYSSFVSRIWSLFLKGACVVWDQKNVVLFSLEGLGVCFVSSVLCCIHNFIERTLHVLRLEVVRFCFVSFFPSQVLFIYFILNQKEFANMKWTAWPKGWEHYPVGHLCLWAPHKEAPLSVAAAPSARCSRYCCSPWAGLLISLCFAFSPSVACLSLGAWPGLRWDWGGTAFSGDGRRGVEGRVLWL